MTIRGLRFASIFFAALALIPSGAHLLELPNKIGLAGPDYLTVQQIYRGWALAGVLVAAALIAAGSLAFQARRDRAQFLPALIATLCIAATQLVFWTLNFPANQETRNWSVLPENWEALRWRWEIGHAMSALLNLGALAALIVAVMRGERVALRTPASTYAHRRPERLELEEVEP
jgi:hypothetical protein